MYGCYVIRRLLRSTGANRDPAIPVPREIRSALWPPGAGELGVFVATVASVGEIVPVPAELGTPASPPAPAPARPLLNVDGGMPAWAVPVSGTKVEIAVAAAAA